MTKIVGAYYMENRINRNKTGKKVITCLKYY